MTRLIICNIVHIVLSDGIVYAHFTPGHLGWVLFSLAFIDFKPYVFRRVTVFPLPLGFGTMRYMRHWISQNNSPEYLLYITLFVVFTPQEKKHAMYQTSLRTLIHNTLLFSPFLHGYHKCIVFTFT